MSGLSPEHRVMLENSLDALYVPHLPALLDAGKNAGEVQRKNRSRALAAFALHHLARIAESEAAAAVVDDFDDYGVDAIYYHAVSQTVFLVQAKLKAGDQFSQAEALAFCQGIRKLIKQDFAGFNEHVQARRQEIEGALEECEHIRVVLAHVGSGISQHAAAAIDELLDDEDHGEERLTKPAMDYDASRIVGDLRAAKAYLRCDADMFLQKCQSIQEPRTTYFGLACLTDLVKLHQKHGLALYERNIRTFLGHKTDVNAAIRQTLIEDPEEFLYLNNGIAGLCMEIESKESNQAGGRKRLRIRGLSVINGAQTIASAARLLEDDPTADIAKARVFITLIKAAADSDFGKTVTRSRNHQNLVSLSSFVALDDAQERLRRELAYLGIRYVYKADSVDNRADAARIQLDEAVQALALFQSDPRFVVWLKKEPSRLFDTAGDQYKALFPSDITAFQLVNAVRFLRYVQKRMIAEAEAAGGKERLTYKHGLHAAGWVLAKRVRAEQQTAKLFDDACLRANLSVPFDELRHALWNATQQATATKGPLAVFRNQTDAVPLLADVLAKHCGLGDDAVLGRKRREQSPDQPYPQGLFDYLVQQAPQIRGLA